MEENYGRTSKESKEAFIKRIVAVEGDVVEMKNGKLYINNELRNDPFTNEDAVYKYGPVTVPPGQVLVLGGNWNHSLDGHICGFYLGRMLLEERYISTGLRGVGGMKKCIETM